MQRCLVLLAGLLVPAHALAADAGAVQGSIQVTGHVPASCRIITGSLGGESGWACNNQVRATVTRLDAAGDSTTLARLTIRPVV
ncbi:MAG: hypothetical protein ABW194_09925 [Novosphingobium sp.]